MKRAAVAAVAVAVSGLVAVAQQSQRPLSPRASAATQVGGEWVKAERGERYQGGKWIEIDYGAPIKRGRTNLFGSGAEYGQAVKAGAPVWRAGANKTTRLETEVPLQFGGKTVPAGEYSVFIDPKSETDWTLILSTWAAQEKFDRDNKEALWGAYNYTPDKDVARVPMTVEQIDLSVDQLTWTFVNVTKNGGSIAIVWDNVLATAPFTIAGQ